MADDTNIARINLTLADGKKFIGQLEFSNAQLVINDKLMHELLNKMKINDKDIVRACDIELGANNIAVNIKDYTLIHTIYFSAFYNMPSNISIFQSLGTNVHIVNQKIDLLQLDCQEILLAECQIRQLDVGSVEQHAALTKSRLSGGTPIFNAYKMKSLDIRGCHITTLKTYVECDYINLQESFMGSLCFSNALGSTIPASINKISIWNYCEIGVCEIYCPVVKLSIKDSSISTIAAKAKCALTEFVIKDTEIINAHNFDKKHFSKLDLNAWKLISKSAGSSSTSNLKSEANYQIAKQTYALEKGVNWALGKLFGFCTGYGYKPMRIIVAFLSIIICSCAVLTIIEFIAYGHVQFTQIANYLAISIAALAGQSGLTLQDGLKFWVAMTEYLTGVVLFAMFVNALYVRYKD